MAHEEKTTVTCDICGKIVEDARYYSCVAAYAAKNDYSVRQSYFGTTIDRIPTYNETHQDVCETCWNKMFPDKA